RGRGTCYRGRLLVLGESPATGAPARPVVGHVVMMRVAVNPEDGQVAGLPVCELLGMECNVPTDIVFSFSGLALRGGKKGPHKDGWGLSLYDGNAVRTFLEPSAAADSPLARYLRENPIKTLLAVAHVRKKTRGTVSLANTHPFVRELWGRS